MKTNPTRFAAGNPTTTNPDRLAAAAHDAGLVQRFKSGDESAFTEIIRRHYARARSLAYRILRSQSDAEEVAQDTFIRAHRSLADFRGDSSLGVWLNRIALNLARNRYWFHFRRRRHDTISIDCPVEEGCSLLLVDALSDGCAAPRSATITSEFVALLAEGIRRLDPNLREILLLRTHRNLSYEEIATSLHLNIGTVKSRIARARESLLGHLREQAPELGRQSTTFDFFETARTLHAPGLVPA